MTTFKKSFDLRYRVVLCKSVDVGFFGPYQKNVPITLVLRRMWRNLVRSRLWGFLQGRFATSISGKIMASYSRNAVAAAATGIPFACLWSFLIYPTLFGTNVYARWSPLFVMSFFLMCLAIRWTATWLRIRKGYFGLYREEAEVILEYLVNTYAGSNDRDVGLRLTKDQADQSRRGVVDIGDFIGEGAR